VLGEQLELWPRMFARDPWAGVSPRALTKGAGFIIFTARAEGVRLVADVFQLSIFEEAEEKCSEGAPTLLPLPVRAGRRGGSSFVLNRGRRD